MRPSNINVAHSFIYPHLHPSSIFNRSKDEFCLQISRLLRPLIPRRTYRVKPACMRSHLSYWLHVLMNAGTKFWISLPTRALFFFVFCYLWYDVPSASFYVTSVSTVFFFSLFVSVGKKREKRRKKKKRWKKTVLEGKRHYKALGWRGWIVNELVYWG